MKNLNQILGISILSLTFLLLQLNLKAQQVHTVCASGCDFTAIQPAINAANEGDTIEVEAGNYEENLTINKPLTLIGANEDNDCDSRVVESVIAPTSGAPVTITSDDVSINGFEINAPGHGTAIELSNTGNVSILHNRIHNIGTDPGFGGPPTNSNTVHSIRYQLDAGSYSNVTISNNCISNISHPGNTFNSASGIGILQSTSQGTLTDLTIEGNTIENVNANTGDWSEGGRIAYGILINVGGNANFPTNGSVVNALISGNEIDNLNGYISTGIGLEGNTEDALVTGNTVSNLTGYKVSNRAGGGYDLQALKFENNRYVSTVTVEHNSFQTNTFTHNDPDGVGYAVANYVDAGEYGTADVSCNWFGTDDANEIADNEDMTGLVFAKEDSEITFIPFLVTDDINDPDCSGQGPVSVYDGDPDESGVFVNSYATIQQGIDAANDGYFVVLAAGVYDEAITIDRSLTIQGPNYNLSPNDDTRMDEAVIRPPAEYYGIEGMAEEIDVVIKGVTIDGQNLTEFMFRVQAFNENVWTFERNIVSNYAGPASNMFQINTMTDSEFIISDNRFIDNGVSNGIRMQQQAIKDITITNNVWLNNQGWALNLTGVRGVISNNEFIDTEGNHSEWFEYQHGIVLAGNQNDIIISDNTFNGVYKAINFYDDATYFAGSAEITENIFTNVVDVAVYVRNDEGNPGLDLSEVILTSNSFTGNNISIRNPLAQTLDANCNWWGQDTGPEIGQIEGEVDVSLWLLSDNLEDPDCYGPVHNLTQGKFYAAIQEAINDAIEGDEIEVAPGTYVEALQILTNNITLRSSEGAASTIIDADGATNAIEIGEYNKDGIHPTGVMIDGFTIEGWTERGVGQRNGNGTIQVLNNTIIAPLSGAAVRGGIILSGGDGSEVVGNTITIPEFGAVGWSSAAIMLLGTTNALVEENTVTGHPDIGDIGIGIFGYPDWESIDPNWVEATGNVIRGNTVGKCGSGIGLAGNVSNSTIEENNILDNERGVNEYPQLGGVPSDNLVDNNVIEDNEWGIRISGALENEITYSAMTITNNTFTNNFPYQLRDFSAELDLDEVLANNSFDRGVVLRENPIVYPHIFSSIQDAIDAANEGEIIDVLPGVYVEVLEIVEKDDISIIGADKETTIIRANNSDLVNWPAYHQHSSRLTAVLIDRSTDINIQSMTFDFDNVGTGSGHTGLMMWNSTGSFEGNAFINRGIAGQQVDVNAYVGADETTVYDPNNRAAVSFIGNEFVNTGRIGLNVQDFVFVTVEDNDFTKTFDDPGYGIEMASLSNGLIKGNTFSNFNTTFTDGSVSSAIYIHNNFTQNVTSPLVKQVDVEDNTIDNCTHGIYIGSTSGGTYWGLIGSVSIESSVSGNTVTNSEIAGVFVTDDGASLGSGITVDFQNNTIDGGDYGYHLNTYWGDGDIAVSISNDKIENVGTGVLVIDYNDFYNDPSESQYDIEVFETSISSFSDFAIRNQYDEITVTATCNWYGTSDAGIIAASISGDVDFFPWLTNGTDDEPGEPGFTPIAGACDLGLFVQMTDSQDPNCPGGSDGSIAVTVSDGQAPYSFSWEGPGGFTSNDQNLSGLFAGVYSLTVTDNAANTAVFSTELFDPVGEVEVDQVGDFGPLCAGDQLEVSFEASGLGSSHTFVWTNDNMEIGPASGSGDIDFPLTNSTSEAQTATISVIATSDLGCESNPMTFEVTVACVTISGLIAELDGTPMEGVTVSMTGDDSQTTQTDEFGEYSFDQAVGLNFVITPEFGQLFQSPADLSNFGVSSADATAILNHLNGSEILTGIPMISADTRSTNNVTGADRIVIAVGLLGNPVAINFWNIQSWFFIEEDHEFSNPAVPWNYASSIVVEGANGNIGNVDFQGIRKGDITGTLAALDDFYNPVSRSGDMVNLLIKDQYLLAGELIEVKVRFSDFESITSMQFALEFALDQLEFSDLVIGDVLHDFDEQNIGLYGLDQGIIRVVWATSSENAQTLDPNDVVFTLVFECRNFDDLKLSGAMGIAENDIRPLAFSSQLEMPIKAMFEEALSTGDIPGEINRFSAVAQPNPFRSQSLIMVNMPVAGEVEFEIYGSDGRLLNQFVRTLPAGMGEVIIDDQLIHQSGLYFIKLRTESGATSLRLLKADQ